MNEHNEFDVNERIKTLREFLNMSRDEFALKLRIKSNQLASIELKRQKAPAWYIEVISKEWFEYGYWVATGMEIPEAGQISPATKEVQDRLNIKAA